MRKDANCVWVRKKKLQYFIIYVNSVFSAFCLLWNREEICVVGLDFVDVWGNWFFLKELAELFVTCLGGIAE